MILRFFNRESGTPSADFYALTGTRPATLTNEEMMQYAYLQRNLNEFFLLRKMPNPIPTETTTPFNMEYVVPLIHLTDNMPFFRVPMMHLLPYTPPAINPPLARGSVVPANV